MRRILQTLIILLAIVFFLSVAAFVWVHVYYSAALPPALDKPTGHVYRMIVNHGFVVYGTERQLEFFRVIDSWFPFGCLFGLAAGLLNWKYKPFEKIVK